jgi:hypothetical protein
MLFVAPYRRSPDGLSAFAGCFSDQSALCLACQSEKQVLPLSSTNVFTKHICISKEVRANARLLFEKSRTIGKTGICISQVHAGETTATLVTIDRAEKGSPAGHTMPRGNCQAPPHRRRLIAASGDRAAGHRRSEIDLSTGSAKPRKGNVTRDTASTASAATPAVDDTLTPRFLRDRRGARPGSLPLFSGSRLGSAPCARRRSRLRSSQCARARKRAAIHGNQRPVCRGRRPRGRASTRDHRPDGRFPFHRREMLRLFSLKNAIVHRLAPAKADIKSALREKP